MVAILRSVSAFEQGFGFRVEGLLARVLTGFYDA